MATDKETSIEKKHSVKSMLSFTTIYFGLRASTGIITTRFTFFYETEILLPIGLMTFAIIFYTIWDMFNDPLAGHLTDRNYRFTRRWGRRFPWIISSSLPVIIVFVLFFTPPDPQVSGVWSTFFWFLIMLMIFDGLTSVAGVGYNSLLINKFRSDEERLKVSAFQQLLSTLSLVVSLFIPPFIIVYGNRASYMIMALICGIILLISVILSIPGLREEKELIESYFKFEEKRVSFVESFFGMLKVSLKQKNFRSVLIITISLSVFNLIFIASIPYYIRYVLKAEATIEFLLYLPFILAATIPIPVYFWLSKKFGHLKVYVITFFAQSVVLFVMMFVYTNLVVILILVTILGISVGISNISGTPVVGDCYDEAAVLNKKRQEGIYLGIQTFFGRLMYIVQLFVFWIIHDLTGFAPEAATQTPLAQFGIIIHMMLIPGAAMLIGILLFMKTWDLKGDKVKKVKEELKALQL